MFKITVHCLLRNEDQFVKYALKSILPFVSDYIIYDTGSTDKTLEILNAYKFEEKGLVDKTNYVALRNEMIAKTKTDWFLLLDGDEVWNQKILADYLEFTLKQPKNIQATYLRARNCVGDVFHYRNSGNYEIAGMKGSLNIRAYRKSVQWTGEYPLEKCVDSTDKNSLAFFEGYYWHMTHLKRSSSESPVMGFRKRVYDMGIKSDNLPEVFQNQNFSKRDKIYEVISAAAGVYRKFL
ncbi:MAG: glycosyltransferase [bacterium]|nr:glycosyltransferase [bacterium]